MQKAVRLRAADFDFWGNTPTPEFCENSHERGPRSPAGTAEGFDPPLGAQRSAAARGGGCAGAGWARWKDGGVPWRAGRGRAFAGAARGGRCAGRNGGRFRRGSRGLSARRRAANGARAGLGRVGPTKAACWARRRGAGTFPGDGARAVYGGFPGRTRGRRGPGRRYTAGGPGIAGGGGPIAGARQAACGTGEKRSELRGLCRVTGHRWEGRQRRGRKGPFSLYKEALFAGARALSIQS